jgi:deoxyribodipyrimidine photo-lyase
VLPVFIFDEYILDKLFNKKDKRVVFIHQTLEQINAVFKENGSSLYVLHDTPLGAFEKICSNFDVKEVFANHDFEPYAWERDQNIKDFLAR